MTSYSYPNNPIIPPAQADQTGLPSYGAAQPAYNRYLPGAQPDAQQQWNQANAAYGQPAAPAAPQYQSYDQASAYNVNPAAVQPPQVPQYGYPPADNSYGSYAAGAGAGGGYQMKNDNFGKGNFRGNNSGNNRSGPGFNKGDRGNYGASGMEEQQDTIFVSGISEDTTEEQLKEHFGAIGLIKIDKKTRKPKIWVYKDKETGKPKGEVTITYDDYPTASSAIAWFNGKELNGAVLKVELAQRRNNFVAGGGGGGGFSGNRGGGNFGNRGNRDFSDRNQRSGGGGGGGAAREGDWVCPGCQNNNFAWRNSCNRCKEEKPADAGGDSSGKSGGGGLPYERRGGPNQGGNRGSYGGPRNNRNGDQSGGFNRGGGRDQRGGGGGNRNGSFGGPMRNNSDNRRSGPY